jgi:peptidoglycan hydrolase CwlO-like protein
MKTRTLALLAGICFFCPWINPVFSQENIEIKTEKATMSKGTQPGYIVEVPMVVLKDLQLNWTKKLQENVKAKVINTNNELVLSNVVKTEITFDTMSIYTVFLEQEDRVVMNVFFEIDSSFFGPGSDKTVLSVEKIDNSIQSYLRKFAVDQYRLAATGALEAQQKILEAKQEEYEDLEKENEKLTKEISSLENEIDKTERSISDLEKQIELKNQEVLTHTGGMASIGNAEEKKAAEQKKKDLEKEKNKMEKDRTNLKNDVSDMKSEISKNEKTIEDNNKLMEEKQAEIDAQTQEVAKAQAFLDGIK